MKVGVVGLGYVGLPLAVELASSGHTCVGFETNSRVVDGVNKGISHIGDVDSEAVSSHVQSGMLKATTDMSLMSGCDAISICVPTPLNKIKDPDLSYVVSVTRSIREHLRKGQLIILESTTYPGTTDEVMLPILEQSGFKVGEDFYLCFSPERVDPGNQVWHTRNTPKVIGGVTETCLEKGVALYEDVFDQLVPVESARAAELVKVYENTFRMINIALANELAQACEKLEVNVWNVIDAAATKPFGFMKFTPGPGLGGHCIPLDPHYLSWKMRTLAFKTRMIDLASEINGEMPAFVLRKASDILNASSKSVKGSRILIMGVSYKKDIDDLRESPAIEIIRLFQERGAQVEYYDPYCQTIEDDGHTDIKDLPMQSLVMTDNMYRNKDLVIIVTDHSSIDYDRLCKEADLVLDTRGRLRDSVDNVKVISL